MSEATREIERKFLLEKIPDLPTAHRTRIEQGYLVTEGAELRLRRLGSRDCRMTVKDGSGLVRREWETAIPVWVFEALWPRTAGARIVKERYSVGFRDHLLEVDLFLEDLEGLCLLEVELPGVEEAKAFRLPEWVGEAREVTEDPAYANRALALDGRPGGAGPGKARK